MMGVDVLREIVAHDQVWPKMAAKYGVEDPVPPWKTSLDGLCDALDRADCNDGVPTFQERRDEEDALAATVYADLPHPESQLVALAHSLLSRGVITEDELVRRLAVIRARLEG